MKFGQDNKYKVIVHNTTYLSVLEILKMVMPFVALPYLISTVGADKYGLVVFAQAIISYYIYQLWSGCFGCKECFYKSF